MVSSKHINTRKAFSLNLAKPANNEAKCIQHLTLCNILLYEECFFRCEHPKCHHVPRKTSTLTTAINLAYPGCLLTY